MNAVNKAFRQSPPAQRHAPVPAMGTEQAPSKDDIIQALRHALTEIYDTLHSGLSAEQATSRAGKIIQAALERSVIV